MNWIAFYTLIRKEVGRTFRVVMQTLAAPLISAALYIFIFGFVVGSKIELINNVRYIEFVIPGILMMTVVGSAYGSTSTAVYFGRWIKTIQEMLVAPLSHIEMVLGFTISGIVRGMLVGVGVLILAVLFGVAHFAHVWIFLFYIIGVSAIFSLIGILVGLWSEGFEQLQVLSTFFITPLTFLGGVFYSVSMLPEKVRFLATWNPFFYWTDGLRYGMVGVSEANQTVGVVLTLILAIGLAIFVERLFARGWKIRE